MIVDGANERLSWRKDMRIKWLPALILAILLPSVFSCYYHHHYAYGYPVHYPYGPPAHYSYHRPAGELSGFNYYPDAPRFAATDPARVALLKSQPRRELIRLGEVWMRPSPDMDRYYVEGVLRNKAAGMGADALVIVADREDAGQRQIAGIAIRYKR
jgi:hypothetical protein